MYSDLFDQLGGGVANRAREAADRAAAATGPPPLVSFKAGTVVLTPLEDADKFDCKPNTTRGEVRLVWKDSQLQWQWYDRREKKVMDTSVISADQGGGSFQRVVLDPKKHPDDRVYVWTKPYETLAEDKYTMYWMQDADPSKDDEIVSQVNEFLKDPKRAAPPGEAAGTSSSSSTTTAGANSASNQAQVDALSSILENLGMPQQGASPSTTSSSSLGGGGGNILTLADLQGAMASVQQQRPAASAGPSLAEIVTPGAISSLLQDEAVCQRLLQFLPEDQQTREHLEENLRSPQVSQTLRSLTMALLPDSDTGNLDGLYSVLANFGLESPSTEGGAPDAMIAAANNPIQAFLDAVLKSVEKEKQSEEGGAGRADGEGDSSADHMETEESKDE